MKRKDELSYLQNNIVNKALVIGYAFGLISYFVTVYRSLLYGMDEAFVVITFVVAVFGGIVYFRKKLKIGIKIYSIMFVVLIAMVTGLSKFGFLVSSKAYIILIPIFVSFVLGYRKAMVMLLLYSLVYGFFGFLYISGIKDFNIDANAYVMNASAWLMDICIIILTAVAVLYVSKNYSDTILDKLSVIRKKNKDLTYREKRYRYLFENSFDAIIITKGTIIYDINERGLELFDCERERIIGKTIVEVSTEYQNDGSLSKNRIIELTQEVKIGKPQCFEWIHNKFSGEEFLASISLALIQYDDSQFYQAVIKDITLQKKQEKELEEYKCDLERLVQTRTEELEQTNEELTQSNYDLIEQRNELGLTLKELHKTQEKLIESEKMASMGVLTAGVAHEINNPLNYIQSGLYSLQTLAEGKYDDLSEDKLIELKKDVVNGMEEGVKRINDIVQSLQRFNKKDAKNFSSCNIRVIIEDCLNILAYETTARINVLRDYPEEEVIVNGNDGELHQAFINIFYNAVYAIKNKGEISIQVLLNKEANQVRVTVKDSGIGMCEEVMSRIFEPFFTTKDVGTGLGLSSVYNILKKHGGHIKVNSEINRGSNFIVFIPLKG